MSLYEAIIQATVKEMWEDMRLPEPDIHSLEKSLRSSVISEFLSIILNKEVKTKFEEKQIMSKVE